VWEAPDPSLEVPVFPRRLFLMTAALFLALAVPLSAQDRDDRPGIGVMPIANGGSHGPDAEAENFEGLEVGLQQMLLSELSFNPELRIVERSQIAEIIREQGLADQELVDPSTAAQVGRIVGARYMIFGQFTDIYGTMRMDIRAVDVETTEIVGVSTSSGESAEVIQILVDVADGLSSELDLPPLPEEIREQREEEAQQVPDEGFREYSRALMLIDQGFAAEGMESLERVVERFPEWDEPKRTLEKERTSTS
jgi:TolB-like protein